MSIVVRFLPLDFFAQIPGCAREGAHYFSRGWPDVGHG